MTTLEPAQNLIPALAKTVFSRTVAECSVHYMSNGSAENTVCSKLE